MATFKELTAQDIKTSRTHLTQLIDVVSEDISGSNSRRSYAVFVTGGVGPGVTSSMFQTVYDQNFLSQFANPVFDMTFGLWYSGSSVQNFKTGEDTNGKLLFPSYSLMMREKVDIYKQFAQNLLGDNEAYFTSPYNSTGSSARIDEALFLCFRRLYARDGIDRETFAMRFYQTATNVYGEEGVAIGNRVDHPNLNETTQTGSTVYSDIGSSVNRVTSFGGNVGNIINTSNTTENVGLLFYDQGIAVIDFKKVAWANQKVSGVIDALNSNTVGGVGPGKMILGHSSSGNNPRFIPDFVVSSSIDDILEHVASTRFSSSSNSSFTFQNITNINSTLVFCRLTADDFNYSSNPTYVDSTGRMVVIDEGQEGRQLPFTFVTTIGLYDANDNLLAVGKLSRPIEKNPEKDLTLRVRLDF
jgi:hypothetical protein